MGQLKIITVAKLSLQTKGGVCGRFMLIFNKLLDWSN